MSQKVPLPCLTGHRLKTRKRDEKKLYDPTGFRDAILEGLNECGNDLDAAYKFLDTAGSKLDYRRYGQYLVEILVSGGLLAPGGTLLQNGEVWSTNMCLFSIADSMDMVRQFDKVFLKVVRRYKYLEKMHEEEMYKILVYLKGFTENQKLRLAQITGLWIVSGQIPASILPVLINEHQVRDGNALNFLLDVLCTAKSEKGSASVINILKKSGIESRLMDFFSPVNQQQTEENLINIFKQRDLHEIVTYRSNQAAQGARIIVQNRVRNSIQEEMPNDEIVMDLKKSIESGIITEQDAVVMVWNCLMTAVEWNKKEDLLQDQALRHLRSHIQLIKPFSCSSKAELDLLNKIQEYCFDNRNFLKAFSKIILLLYKTDVISEEVILHWYKGSHSSRGWSAFMDQISSFIKWLEDAEEESDEEGDDDEAEAKNNSEDD